MFFSFLFFDLNISELITRYQYAPGKVKSFPSDKSPAKMNEEYKSTSTYLSLESQKFFFFFLFFKSYYQKKNDNYQMTLITDIQKKKKKKSSLLNFDSDKFIVGFVRRPHYFDFVPANAVEPLFKTILGWIMNVKTKKQEKKNNQ